MIIFGYFIINYAYVTTFVIIKNKENEWIFGRVKLHLIEFQVNLMQKNCILKIKTIDTLYLYFLNLVFRSILTNAKDLK